jgi:hypothetical protein
LIKVGDTALLDGVAPEGNVLLTDGRTITFEAGVVTEIKEKLEDGPDEGDEEIETLRQENATLKAELEKRTVTNTEQAETIKSVEAKLLESTNILKNVEKIQSQMLFNDKKDKKEINKNVSKLGDAVNNLLKL